MVFNIGFQYNLVSLQQIKNNNIYRTDDFVAFFMLTYNYNTKGGLGT